MVSLASARKRSQKQSREEDEKGEGVEGERRGLVQRHGQGEGLVKGFPKRSGSFLREATSLHRHVETRDLM